MDTIIAVTTEVNRKTAPRRHSSFPWPSALSLIILVSSLCRSDLPAVLFERARATNAQQSSLALTLPNLQHQESARGSPAYCPKEMVLVEGDYCPVAVQHCEKWLDDPNLPFARCGTYAKPASCRSPRERLRFCIDREEYTAPGDSLPLNQMSLNKVDKLCRSVNKRLCEEREWNFACEGEEMRPYPYGWSRQPKCNQDRTDLTEMRHQKEILRDLRRKGSELRECVSPFGVLNLVGNLDEPVLRDGSHFAPMRTALKGGWWMPSRNRCRPATTAHDDYFEELQIGARCCADPASQGDAPTVFDPLTPSSSS